MVNRRSRGRGQRGPIYRMMLATGMVTVLLVAAACGDDNAGNQTSDEAADESSTPEEDTSAQPDSGAASEAVELRIGFVASSSLLGGEDFLGHFVETIEEESEGRITVTPFYDAALGSQREMLTAVQDGSLDMAVLGTNVVAAVEPAFDVIELPYLWPDTASVYEGLDGQLGDELLDKLESQGVKGLAWGEWGFRAMVSQNEIRDPEDFQGTDIRVPENPLYLAVWETLGATPVSIPWPETYTGLQQGLVEAVDTNIQGFVDASLDEVTDYLVMTDHQYTALLMMINAETWAELSSDTQEQIENAAAAAQENHRSVAAEAHVANRQTLEDRGMEVIELDAERLREITRPIHSEFEEQIGSEIVQTAQEIAS